MYFIANKTIRLGSGLIVDKGKRVPDEVPLFLCARYEKLELMKKVFDSEVDVDDTANLNIEQQEIFADIIEDYKLGKDGKRGLGIKKLADKYNISQYAITKLLKKEGLL